MTEPTPSRLLSAIFVAVLVAAASAPPSYGQVTLAPTFVYVDGPDPYGSVLITNTTAREQEVFVDFEFGYPAVDSTGRRYIEYEDDEAASAYSASSWIRSFPQRFRIAPKHRQRVRIMLSPPHDLGEGVYWTRMVVTSREEAPRGGDAARVDFELRQVVPIVFNHGRTTTSAEIAGLDVVHRGETSSLLALVERVGDVPFLGSITLRLFDSAGVAVEETTTKLDVYFRNSVLFTLDRDDAPPGRYTAEVELVAERSDVYRGDLPFMEPVLRRFAIDIPERLDLTSAR